MTNIDLSRVISDKNIADAWRDSYGCAVNEEHARDLKLIDTAIRKLDSNEVLVRELLDGLLPVRVLGVTFTVHGVSRRLAARVHKTTAYIDFHSLPHARQAIRQWRYAKTTR